MKMLLKNLLILKENDHIIKGHIIIEKNIIGEIMKLDDSDLDESLFDTIIDYKGKIAIPGLCNAHTHVGMSILRNYADDMNLETWLFDKIFPIEDKLDGEIIFWSSMLSIMEMIKTGTTLFNDMYFFEDMVFEACKKTKIRSNLSRGLQSFKNFDFTKDMRINENIELIKLCQKSELMSVSFGPHSVYTCTEDYLKYISKLAKEYNIPIHMHISETKKENSEIIMKYGITPIRFIDNLELINNKTILADCVYLNEEDINIVKKRNANIVHCPTSNLKLASGVMNIKNILNENINICLGTDSASSNNSLDMFQEMKLAALLHKGIEKDPELVDAKFAIKMATENGYLAMGYKNGGSIKKGNLADIVILNNDNPEFYPRNNIFSNIVYSNNGNNVYSTIINGEVVYENGTFYTLDKESIYAKINEISKRIF